MSPLRSARVQVQEDFPPHLPLRQQQRLCQRLSQRLCQRLFLRLRPPVPFLWLFLLLVLQFFWPSPVQIWVSPSLLVLHPLFCDPTKTELLLNGIFVTRNLRLPRIPSRLGSHRLSPPHRHSPHCHRNWHSPPHRHSPHRHRNCRHLRDAFSARPPPCRKSPEKNEIFKHN